MHLLRSLQNAKQFSSLLHEPIPVGLPMRPDALTLKGCVFFGCHGDLSAFIPEPWTGIEVSVLGCLWLTPCAETLY